MAGLRGVTRVFSTIGDTTGRIARGQGDVTDGYDLRPLDRSETSGSEVVRS